MNNNSDITHQLGADTPFDLIVLVLAGVAALGWGLSHLGWIWQQAITALVNNHVLVAAHTHPRLVLPRCFGAGLDTTRLFILAGIALAALAALMPRIMARRALRALQRS